jgi:hypothetical protein
MIAVAVTIVLALAGYIVTYLNSLRLAQRQERLARVNRQLGDFYGPLFAITEANSRTFAAFRERHARAGDQSPFSDTTPPTEQELTEWRLWLATVFLPNIQQMRDLVINHADLLRDPEMPQLLLQLCAHVSGYEITVARWEHGDYDHHLSVTPYPVEIRTYAGENFNRLKAEQEQLLGRRPGRLLPLPKLRS